MNRDDVLALFGDAWELEEARSVATEDMPAFLRRADPTDYRLTRRNHAASGGARTGSTEDLPST